MEHQYPGAISGDENMLAELMLPDQAHVRKQDWTIFFLHKDTSEEDDKEEGVEGDSKGRQGASSTTNRVEGEPRTEAGQNGATADATKEPEEMEGGEGPPLIYVLNLVNTKSDTSAKRFSLNPSLQAYENCLTLLTQGRCCQGHGCMYTTFFPSHLQGNSANMYGRKCCD